MLKNKPFAFIMAVGAFLIGASLVTSATPQTERAADLLPADKQALLKKEQEHRQLGTPAPKSSDTSLKPVEAEAWPTGIRDDIPAPFPASEVSINNVWQRDFAGNHVQAYAGHITGDEQQGLLIIRTTSINDLDNVTVERFQTHDKTGSLTVTSEQNHKLTLQSTSGATYEFDVNKKQFTQK